MGSADSLTAVRGSTVPPALPDTYADPFVEAGTARGHAFRTTPSSLRPRC